MSDAQRQTQDAPHVPQKKSGKFQKGKPPGPGRPKGRLNKATLEIRAFSQKLFGGLFKDPNYKKALRDRILRGKEPPANVALLLAYGYGKPPDKLIIEDPDGTFGTPVTGARREELIERLCNRFAAIVAQGTDQAGVVTPVHGRAGGPVLELEARREAEPAATNGHLDHVADLGRQRMGQSTRPEHADPDPDGVDHDGKDSDWR